MKKFLLSVLTIVLMVVSCAKHDWSSLVSDYFFPSGYHTSSFLRDSLIYLRVDFDWNKSFNLFYGSEKEKAQFAKYASYYNDHGYDRYHNHANYEGCAVPIGLITITCDRDLDDLHPKGANLNSLFRIHFNSSYMSVLRGYDSTSILVDEHLENLDYHVLDVCSSTVFFRIPSSFLKEGEYTFYIDFKYGPDPIDGHVIELEPAEVKVSIEQE